MTPVTAQILDGTATAKAIKAELTTRVAALREQGVVPGLGTVLVGDDPGSKWYVAGKHKDCAEVGITSIRVDLPETATQAEVEEHVDRLNADPACTGYIVQLPLPKHMDVNAVLDRMDPAKDVDGLHPTNLGWLVLGKDAPAALHAVRHPRAAAPPRRGDRRRRGGRGRPRGHGRPAAGPAAHPSQRERHRDALPHRHP